jgi:hypothetical protein
MQGNRGLFETLRREWANWRSKANVRFDAMERQLEEYGSRLDRYDKPVHTRAQPNKGKAAAKPIPIPSRPAVMEASGVGEDPR